MLNAKSIDGLFKKVAGGFIVGLVGVTFGYLGGGVFETMGIYAESIPWQEAMTFLGGPFGFGLGASLD